MLNCDKRRELLMPVPRELKAQLQHAANLLGASGGDAWKCVQQIARKFGFKLTASTERGPRSRDGTRPRQFKSIRLDMELAHFVDAWSLYDARYNPARFVPVSQWDAHEDQLDLATIEAAYRRTWISRPALRKWTQQF